MSRCPIFGACMRKTKTVWHKHGKYVCRITMLRMKNFVVEQNELLSSRICRKCAMKIRNAVPAVLLIHEELNRSLQKSEYFFLHTHPDKEKQETELCKTFEANECMHYQMAVTESYEFSENIHYAFSVLDTLAFYISANCVLK